MHKFIKKLLKGEKVEWKKLGEVCELKRGKTITAKQVIAGDIPVISGSIKPTHFHNEANRFGETITIAGSGTAGFVSYWNKPIWVGDAFSVIPKENNLLTKYIYYFLNSNQDNIYKMRKGGIIQHVYPKDVAEMIIPIPPINVQKEIIDILDQFCQLKTALKTEKILREKQYAFYRDKLLGFGEGVPWKMLKEICIRQKGTKITALKMREIHKENAPVKIFAGGQTVAFVNYGDIPEKDIHNIPSIICKSRGIVGFEYYDKPFSHKNELWSYRAKDESVNLKFVYYFLKNNEDYFQLISQKMQMPQIATPVTDEFKIPLPPIEEQNKIAEILEQFDKLTNSITEGLPHEIDLREKQYQFYRDLLLDFTDKEY